jgi:hypothetical protein
VEDNKEDILKASNIKEYTITPIEEQDVNQSPIMQVRLDPRVTTNPFGIFYEPGAPVGGFSDYRKKPSSLTPAVLRNMAARCEPIAAIINVRCNQVGAFSTPSDDRDLPGYTIRLRDRQATPTAHERDEIANLVRFMENTGFFYNPERKNNFEMYQRAIVRDRLTFGAIATQIIADQKGRIAEFRNWDVSTISFATESYQSRRARNTLPIAYIQEVDGQIVGEFTSLEMAYGIANPTSAIEAGGYGIAELEVLIDLVTSFLFSKDYNKAFFTKNSVPAGILSITGKLKEEELMMFRKQWAYQVKGINNAWNVPIIATEDGKGVDFKPFKSTQRDAEYMKWMDFLIRLISAVYQIAPEEINFETRGSASGSNFVAKEGGQAIMASKDRGLVPLLRFLASYYNTNLIGRMSDKYIFTYTGINPEDKEKVADLKLKRKHYMTVNEFRAEDDLPKLPPLEKIKNPFDIPDIYLNAWLDVQRQKQEREQQAAAMAAVSNPTDTSDGKSEEKENEAPKKLTDNLESPE